MDKFLKVQNFQTSLDAFKDWMRKKYTLDVDSVQTLDAKRLLFSVMKDIKDENIGDKTKEIKDLNNIALNRLQDLYVDKLNLREVGVFGNRPMVQNPMPPPENNSIEKPFAALPPTPQIGSQPPEEPIPLDVFDKMVSSYMNDVNTILPPVSQSDPKALYETQPVQVQAVQSKIDTLTNNQEEVSFQQTEGPSTIIEKTIYNTVQDKYLVINGCDRDWSAYKNRFQFRLDLNTVYKNISTIQFTKLILPFDFAQRVTQPTLIQHDLKMNVPYVILNIDEIEPQYDGFNNAIKKSTTCFVYDTSFKCSNGRGYMVMTPAQNEIKVFQQNLPSFSHMSVSLFKPSGMLISNATDSYTVAKIEYEVYNNVLLKIVLSKFFEKSEFSIGDTVRLKDFIITMPSAADISCTKPSSYTEFNTFINREEGHDIIAMGDANENGYYKNFMIQVPGEFDSDIGKLVPNKGLIDSIKTYNEFNATSMNAKIINMSVQPIIYATVGVESGKVFKANN